MKEFGDSGSSRANLLCTNTYCCLNSSEGALLLAEDAREQAKIHDEIQGHEGVVVYHDNDHPLTSEVGGQVLITTGVVVI